MQLHQKLFFTPHVDILVDDITSHAMFSFMGGFSRYNQTLRALEEMTKTYFITTWGVFYYKVVSCGLKK